MRILITGLTGSLAPKVAAAAGARGLTVLDWDRAAAPTDDGAAGQRFLDGLLPDAVLHLALGPEDWAGLLAAHAGARGIPFLMTSTAMVFDHDPDGPHGPGDARTAKDGYGQYKIRCEDRVFAANPAAMVARIGWQIDPDARGNNMLAHLDGWQRDQGKVEASRLWRPACSFMADTAQALLDLIAAPVAGCHHLDSNADEAHSFDRVVTALAAAFGRDWTIVPTDGYRHDQRLVGRAGRMPGLSRRLPLPESGA